MLEKEKKKEEKKSKKKEEKARKKKEKEWRKQHKEALKSEPYSHGMDIVTCPLTIHLPQNHLEWLHNVLEFKGEQVDQVLGKAVEKYLKKFVE